MKQLAAPALSKLAAVDTALGDSSSAVKECSKSLMVKECPEVYLQRGAIQEDLGFLPLAMDDYEAAAALLGEGEARREAQAQRNRVAAELGTDAKGNPRYDWQREWTAGRFPPEFGRFIKKLVKPSARHVPLGKLMAHPGPDSDINWGDLTSPCESTRNRSYMVFCQAAENMFSGAGGHFKPDFVCGAEWFLELDSLGFQLNPFNALSVAEVLLWCKGGPGDGPSTGLRLAHEAADGKHNHKLCPVAMMTHSEDCVLELARPIRAKAIQVILDVEGSFR